ncbi:NAD(P)H oxidoreductase [Paenibacillus sp. MMS20-IR301]|uniref:NAD(P)H oxidoreductase n=1 Tax=Paenibacillus sp. MMS20-IR301 TaxID=2895946 RepID=UPI0028ECA94A|nr:NAD(P)H oxidoreductase [Paenibacillus sp. MMS20-IR301]WNS41782.1 NAD(P)H oxidoreductase [Paenibacillus sp. MMS20-IR301]
MKVLIVVAHPREDSLTMNVTKRLISGIEAAGNQYELVDLYKEGFNPVLLTSDEPDWNNPDKVYSEEVQRQMKRIQSSEALVFVFPVWWYSVPAIMKGYLDRVWNFGFAYGNSNKLPVKCIRWIALTGFTQVKLEKRNYHQMMEHYFNIGLSGFVGVRDSKVHFMTNTLGEFDDHVEQNKEILFNNHLDEAYKIGTQL